MQSKKEIIMKNAKFKKVNNCSNQNATQYKYRCVYNML